MTTSTTPQPSSRTIHPADGLETVRSAPVELHLPPRSLVVVAGLPGAGKTTLLRRLTATSSDAHGGASGVRALDSEDVAARLTGLPLPYRVLRPLVHATHLVRVVAALWSPSARVLTSDPLTSPVRRRVLRTAARLAGRQLHVVLVHASPAQARDGQHRRGRRLSARRTTRHESRYEQWLGTALGDDVDVVLSREDAATAVLAGPAEAGSAAQEWRPPLPPRRSVSLVAAVRTALREAGLPYGRLHEERFVR